MGLRSPAEMKVELLERLRALGVVAPALAWIGFTWERCTGLTFQLTRGSSHLGAYASPAHVHRAFGMAIGATLIFLPLGLLAHYALQSGKRQ